MRLNLADYLFSAVFLCGALLVLAIARWPEMADGIICAAAVAVIVIFGIAGFASMFRSWGLPPQQGSDRRCK